jgi:hypothetical protein
MKIFLGDVAEALSHLGRRVCFAAPCRLAKALNSVNPVTMPARDNRSLRKGPRVRI